MCRRLRAVASCAMGAVGVAVSAYVLVLGYTLAAPSALIDSLSGEEIARRLVTSYWQGFCNGGVVVCFLLMSTLALIGGAAAFVGYELKWSKLDRNKNRKGGVPC